VPAPGPSTDRPYAPQAILPGGIVVPIWPASSPQLNGNRVKEPEVYNLTNGVPGRIASILNIHRPSVELHRVPAGMNTGAAVIVVAGGGHNTLNVGSIRGRPAQSGSRRAPSSPRRQRSPTRRSIGRTTWQAISSRPDFVGLICPGPTPFRGGAEAPIPADAPPVFIASGGVGDASHAI
jgi:hypothetical protein